MTSVRPYPHSSIKGLTLELFFTFWLLQSAFGHPPSLIRGMSASDAPYGRFNRYFDSFTEWIILENVDEIVSQLIELENETVQEITSGCNDWEIHISLDSVLISHDLFEEWNDGESNRFSYSDFIWIFLAWREFLLMEDQPPGTVYFFNLPTVASPAIKAIPANLLKLHHQHSPPTA